VARRLKKIADYAQDKKLIREALKQLDEKGLAAIRRLHQRFRKARPPRFTSRTCHRSSVGSRSLFHAQNGAPRYSVPGFANAFFS